MRSTSALPELFSSTASYEDLRDCGKLPFAARVEQLIHGFRGKSLSAASAKNQRLAFAYEASGFSLGYQRHFRATHRDLEKVTWFDGKFLTHVFWNNDSPCLVNRNQQIFHTIEQYHYHFYMAMWKLRETRFPLFQVRSGGAETTDYGLQDYGPWGDKVGDKVNAM
jgi:hypothetical protein